MVFFQIVAEDIFFPGRDVLFLCSLVSALGSSCPTRVPKEAFFVFRRPFVPLSVRSFPPQVVFLQVPWGPPDSVFFFKRESFFCIISSLPSLEVVCGNMAVIFFYLSGFFRFVTQVPKEFHDLRPDGHFRATFFP